MFAGPLVGIFKTVSGGPRLAADDQRHRNGGRTARATSSSSGLISKKAHFTSSHTVSIVRYRGSAAVLVGTPRGGLEGSADRLAVRGPPLRQDDAGPESGRGAGLLRQL